MASNSNGDSKHGKENHDAELKNFLQQLRSDVLKYQDSVFYSNRYSDDNYEYRHVQLPKQLCKYLPDPLRLLTENEWRGLGVRQSRGWFHYMIHAPEPHILLFKREKDYDLKHGNKE